MSDVGVTYPYPRPASNGMKIVFFDTETTGNKPEDRLCQLAIKERGIEVPLLNALYKPPIPITIESMVVHHITEKMVADRPLFTEASEFGEIKALFESDETLAVAHNAAFDNQMLLREGIAVRNPVCTYKVARTLDLKDAIPNLQLQYLRYFLGLEVKGHAHDAWGDALVLEQLFERLLAKLTESERSEPAALKRMQEISVRPMLIPTFPFGKHKGQRVADVAHEDRGYLKWLLSQKKQNPLGEEDWIFTLEQYVQ